MRPCCQSCAAGRPEHIVTDAAGRPWRFEMHPFCGPIVLRQDGQPKATQPGSRSPFWPATGCGAWERVPGVDDEPWGPEGYLGDQPGAAVPMRTPRL